MASKDGPGSTTERAGMSARAPVLAAAALFALLVAVFAFPAFVVLCGGMIPTVAAALSDRGRRHHLTKTVAVTNLAGVLPVMAMALRDGQGVSSAMAMLGDMNMWLLILAAAGAGWALLWVGPVFADVIVKQRIESEIKRLQEKQNKLVAEWGRDVLTE